MMTGCLLTENADCINNSSCTPWHCTAPEGFKASVSLAIELYRTELEGIRSTLVRTRSPTFTGYTNQLDFSFAHSPRVHMNQLESLGQNQVRLLNYLSKTVGSPENRMTPGGTLKLTDQTSNFTRGKTQADETKDLLDIIQLARGGVGISTRFSVCQAKDGSTKHIQYQICLKDKIKPLLPRQESNDLSDRCPRGQSKT